MPRLLRSDSPFQDESFLGYLLRVTELNHYRNIKWLFGLAGLPTNGNHIVASILFSGLDLTNLSTLTKCTIEVLKEKTHTPLEQGNYNFFGHPVNKISIHSLYPKICPSCIAETGYCRSVWDFALTTCCHLHNCFLINRCPACKKRLSWFRKEINKCNCGYDFRKYPIENVIPDETEIAENICMKINKTHFLRNSSNPIFDLSLNELYTVIKIFSRDLEKAKRTTENFLSKISGFDIKEAHIRIIKAKNIFDNWPHTFNDLLENTKFCPIPRSPSFGVGRKFGRFMDVINRLSPQLTFIKEAINVYIKERFSDSPVYRSKSLFSGFKSNKYMTKSEAYSFLHISEKRIDQLLDNGTIAGRKVKVKSRHFIMLERSSVEDFKQSIEYSKIAKNKCPDLNCGQVGLSLRQVAEYLSIGRDKVVTLRKGGHITSIPGYRGYNSRAEIDELFEVIDNKVKICGTNHPKMINFDKACYRLSFLGLNISDVLSLIKNGSLVPRFKTSAKGLNAYNFFENEIIAFKKMQLDKRKSNNITIDEYANSIHVSPDNLRFLAKRGFLKSHHSGVWHIGEVLTSESISEFESNYIFLGQIAKCYKSFHLSMLEYLENAGVRPISGPKVDNGIAYLFLRTDLEEIKLPNSSKKKLATKSD